MIQTLLEIKRKTNITTQDLAQQAQLPVADVFTVEAGGFTSRDKASRVLAAFNHLSGMRLNLDDIVRQNAAIQSHYQDNYSKRGILQKWRRGAYFMQTGSEVAALREKIATEYMAGRLGLYGLRYGTPRHDFIEAQQERVAVLHEQLHQLIGDEAIALVVETCDSLPDPPARSDVLTVLQHELGHGKEAELLCADLQVLWGIVDTLKDRFGVETARKMVLAPSSSVRDMPPS
jgi:hypothetical protein